MILRLYNSALVLCALAVLSACYSTYIPKNYYYPTRQASFEFREKGDAQFTASGGNEIAPKNSTDDDWINLQYSAGYAPFNHLGFSLDGFFYNHQGSGLDLRTVAFFGKATGLYHSTEIGLGRGKLEREVTAFKLDYSRMYITPLIGYTWEWFDAAISTRFIKTTHKVHFADSLSESSIDYYRDDYNLLDIGNKDFYFLEPAVTFGLGGTQIVGCKIQISAPIKLSDGQINYKQGSVAFFYLTIRPNMISIKRNK